MRDQGRDLHAEFLRLLPELPRPIAIQRWSIRRVGLMIGVALLALLALVAALSFGAAGRSRRLLGLAWPGAGRLRRRRRPVQLRRGPRAELPLPGAEGTALMVLIAQAVPTATQLPCLELKPAGWTVSDVFVRNGRVRFNLNSDRVGIGAVQVVLEQFCTFGEVHQGALGPSRHPPLPGGHLDRARPALPGAVHYLFPGGCVTYRLDFRSDEQARPSARSPWPSASSAATPCARRSATSPAAGCRSTRRRRPGELQRLVPEKVLTLPRHPGDALRLVAGLAILLGCIATVRPDDVGVLEEDLFRLFNDLPSALYPAFWLVMQAGNVLAVAVASLVVAATRRFWLAANLAITGIGVWLAARWIKEMVGRGRPDDLLDGVHVRGGQDSGLGFVSGHAAVAVAIATLIAPYLGRRARWIAVAWAVGVCVSRIYVGVHLPLDVIGGAALGWAAGSLVHLLLGAPGAGRRPSGPPRP